MAKHGGSRHLKRLAAPKTWKIKRKQVFGVWTVKPIPGPHPKDYSVPLGILLRDYLGLAKTMREARKILSRGEVYIDFVKRKEYKFPVGIFDVVYIPKQDAVYRIVYDSLGRISLLETDLNDAKIKPLYVIRKTLVKGDKIQVTTHDSRNFLFERKDSDNIKVGDTIVYNLEDKSIVSIIRRKEGVYSYLIRGAHRGVVGVIKLIKPQPGMTPDLITIETLDGKTYETIKEYVMPIGEDGPVIKL